MYDIQSALRRREMAERLEALTRAGEATARAAETPDPPRPKHLADSRSTRPRSERLRADRQRTGQRADEPAADVPQRGETLVAVRAPDQTARLDVPAMLTDPEAPPPPRTSLELVVPAGVTLLHVSPELEHPAAADDVPADHADHADHADPVDPAGEPADEHSDAVPDDPPRGGSSAAAIADLLRHGSSQLFFNREAKRG